MASVVRSRSRARTSRCVEMTAKPLQRRRQWERVSNRRRRLSETRREFRRADRPCSVEDPFGHPLTGGWPVPSARQAAPIRQEGAATRETFPLLPDVHKYAEISARLIRPAEPWSPTCRAEKYSSEVQQRHWVRQGFLGFERPDPCSDKPGRPPCPEFATRGSGVRVPSAPPTQGQRPVPVCREGASGSLFSSVVRPLG